MHPLPHALALIRPSFAFSVTALSSLYPSRAPFSISRQHCNRMGWCAHAVLCAREVLEVDMAPAPLFYSHNITRSAPYLSALSASRWRWRWHERCRWRTRARRRTGARLPSALPSKPSPLSAGRALSLARSLARSLALSLSFSL
eukprot:1470204-Rhodomonas_salina.1